MHLLTSAAREDVDRFRRDVLGGVLLGAHEVATFFDERVDDVIVPSAVRAIPTGNVPSIHDDLEGVRTVLDLHRVRTKVVKYFAPKAGWTRCRQVRRGTVGDTLRLAAEGVMDSLDVPMQVAVQFILTGELLRVRGESQAEVDCEADAPSRCVMNGNEKGASFKKSVPTQDRALWDWWRSRRDRFSSEDQESTWAALHRLFVEERPDDCRRIYQDWRSFARAIRSLQNRLGASDRSKAEIMERFCSGDDRRQEGN